MTLPDLHRSNRPFFYGFYGFVAVLVAILCLDSKAGGFFLLNPWHSGPLDAFFSTYTYAGDGYFCFGVGLLIFVWGDRATGLMAIVTYCISGILSQVLKAYIPEARPAVDVHTAGYSHFIENVTLHNFHSFPSGHATSAFALATVLCFAAKNKSATWLYLGLAMLIGYSRIYLGQHFPDDVLAGALLGTVTSVVCWVLMEGTFRKWMGKKKQGSGGVSELRR